MSETIIFHCARETRCARRDGRRRFDYPVLPRGLHLSDHLRRDIGLAPSVANRPFHIDRPFLI